MKCLGDAGAPPSAAPPRGSVGNVYKVPQMLSMRPGDERHNILDHCPEA